MRMEQHGWRAIVVERTGHTHTRTHFPCSLQSYWHSSNAALIHSLLTLALWEEKGKIKSSKKRKKLPLGSRIPCVLGNRKNATSTRVCVNLLRQVCSILFLTLTCVALFTPTWSLGPFLFSFKDRKQIKK